jgi:DNA modification methylase
VSVEDVRAVRLEEHTVEMARADEPAGHRGTLVHDRAGPMPREAVGDRAPGEPGAHDEDGAIGHGCVRLLEGDCAEILAGWPAGCVHAVVTDPPWNLGKDYGTHDDSMPEDAHVAWLGAVLAQCARVSNGPVLFLPGHHMLARVRELLARAGLPHAATLTWRKPGPEPVVWAGRPGPGPEAPSVVAVPEPDPGDPGRGEHPCPKPVELMRALVAAATSPGALVLDPFAGSGTTLLAARQCGRSAVGIELDPRYASLARRRLGA